MTLGLFVKEPRPGRVKTRLARAIGEGRAASLYRAFVADTVTLALNSTADHCQIFHSGAPPSAWMGADWPGGGLGEVPQATGDLGARLDAAFRAGPVPQLILGSDSPDLPPDHLRSALDALGRGADLVLADAGDGGVWCIGMQGYRPGFFDSIPWSTPRTGTELRNRAAATGLKVVEAPPWYDCDLPEDLDALAARLRLEPTGATMTRLHLSHPNSGSTSP